MTESEKSMWGLVETALESIRKVRGDEDARDFRRSASALLDRAFASLPRESFAELLGHIAEEGQRLAVGRGPAVPMEKTTLVSPPAYSVEERVRAEVAERIAAILSPGTEPAVGWTLKDALEGVEKLRHWARETEHEVRDAALEEVDRATATAQLLHDCGATSPEWTAGFNAARSAIRALKSKPAPSPLCSGEALRAAANPNKQSPLCLTPGCEKPTGHAIPCEPCGAKPESQPSGNSGELVDAMRAIQEEGMKRGAEKWERGEMDGPTPEPTHDFGWALARMREGKRVRRKCWKNGQNVWCDSNPSSPALYGEDGNLARIGGYDAFSPDWQVVE